MATLKDNAICIRHWDWSETSQTVSLFTREHGILRGLAKGAKREKSPFSGGIELATRGEIVAIVKAHHSAGGLATLTAWDLEETFPAVRTTLLGFRIAMGMMDAIGRAIRESDPHPALFDGTLHSLRALEGDSLHQRAALIAFLLLLLKETGHAPQLLIDVRTGSTVTPAAILGFSPVHGGVTSAAAQADEIWRVRSETIELLRTLAQGGESPHISSEPTLKRGIGLLVAYLAHVLESDIPALASLRSEDSL